MWKNKWISKRLNSLKNKIAIHPFVGMIPDDMNTVYNFHKLYKVEISERDNWAKKAHCFET